MELLLRRIIIISGVVVPLLYIIGMLSLSLLSGISFNDVILYTYVPVQYSLPNLAGYLIRPAVLLCGLLLIGSFPGVLFTPIFFRGSRNADFGRFLSLGFFMNLLLLLSGTTLLKILGISIDRIWFIIMILIETLIGLILFSRSKISFMGDGFAAHKQSLFCFILVVCVIALFAAAFPNDVFRPLPVNFSYDEATITKAGSIAIGDPQEEFGIAHHLKKRLLPYWFIDGPNKFGVYIDDPHLSYFFNFFIVTLLGESYASFNLLTLLFVGCAFIFVYKIITIDKASPKNALVYIGPVFFMLALLWSAMGPSRRTDLPAAVWPDNTLWDPIEGLWIFLMMGLIYFLLKKDLIPVLIYSILATFCRYESIPCIVILMILYKYIFNSGTESFKKFVRYYLIFLAIFIGYSILLVMFQGGGITYLRQLIFDKLLIRVDYLRARFNIYTAEKEIWPGFSWPNTFEVVKLSLTGTYFFVAIFLLPSKDKIANFVSIFGIIYLASVLFQSHKLTSYVWLLIPIAAINIKRFIYPSKVERLITLLIYMAVWLLGIRYIS